jgi:hypothetical protein
MKILSVFYKHNEIALHNNLLGKKSVYYNGDLMVSKWTFFGGKLTFDVVEDNEEITYTAAFSYNDYGGYCGDVWRDYEPLVLSSLKSSWRPKRPLEYYESDFV